MRKIVLPLTGLATILGFWLYAGAAQAQASRTWVSGLGDDAFACSRTAPCKTFAGAISKTAAGGEIDVLDPGGFGTLTITKAITIDGGGGLVASIVASGTNGIVVQAGANDVVTLRNLRINGLARNGLNGIRYLSGAALHVENCNIFGFSQNGIDAALNGNGQLFIEDTVVRNNGGGVAALSGGGVTKVLVSNTRAEDNSGDGVLANAGAGTVAILVDRSILNSNVTGLSATGAGAVVLVGRTVIAGNATGVASTGGGTVLSYQNNEINGNATDGTPLPAAGLN